MGTLLHTNAIELASPTQSLPGETFSLVKMFKTQA